MDDIQKSVLENIEKNGLLPNTRQPFGSNVMRTSSSSPFAPIENNNNIFSAQASKPNFGALTVLPKQAELKNRNPLKKNSIDGFDTDILVNSKYKKIDDKSVKLQVKIARLKEELSDHQKIVENAYLKADRNQYQKLLEIQNRMETELQKLVAEYQHQQLKSIIFSPFTKLFQFIQNYVLVK